MILGPLSVNLLCSSLTIPFISPLKPQPYPIIFQIYIHSHSPLRPPSLSLHHPFSLYFPVPYTHRQPPLMSSIWSDKADNQPTICILHSDTRPCFEFLGPCTFYTCTLVVSFFMLLSIVCGGTKLLFPSLY